MKSFRDMKDELLGNRSASSKQPSTRTKHSTGGLARDQQGNLTHDGFAGGSTGKNVNADKEKLFKGSSLKNETVVHVDGHAIRARFSKASIQKEVNSEKEELFSKGPKR